MRYKEIDINIKAVPDSEDEALLNQLIGAKKATVSTEPQDETPASDNSDNPGKVETDAPNTVPAVYPFQQELEMGFIDSLLEIGINFLERKGIVWCQMKA